MDCSKNFWQNSVEFAVKIIQGAIYNTAIEWRAHPLFKSFLWVNDVSTCPQLHVVDHVSSFLVLFSVQFLKNSTKIHAHNGAKTESNQSDRFAIRKICF